MGYILPVEQFQYQDYHNRITKEERDPFPIEKLRGVQFGTPYGQEKMKENTFAMSTPNPESSDRNIKQTEKYQTLQLSIYAELTGKGGNFQAQV